MCIAPACGILPTDQYILRHVDERRPRAVDERNEYATTLVCPTTCHERGEDRRDGIFARDHVGECDAHLHRIPVRLASDRHPPALGLRHEIVAGPSAVFAETGDGAPHESAVATHELRRIESMSLERPAPKVVDHNIRVGGETTEDVPVDRRVQIQGYAQLVAIHGEVIGTLSRLVERWPPTTRFVATIGSLDLDDIRPEVAEHHRAERSGENTRQVQHSNLFEHSLA